MTWKTEIFCFPCRLVLLNTNNYLAAFAFDFFFLAGAFAAGLAVSDFAAAGAAAGAAPAAGAAAGAVAAEALKLSVVAKAVAISTDNSLLICISLSGTVKKQDTVSGSVELITPAKEKWLTVL